MRIGYCGFLLALAAAGVGGCLEHVMVPQLVRSYVVEWTPSVGPDGKTLSSQVNVLVANAPYLQDQCANQMRTTAGPLHTGLHVASMGCVRIAPEGRPEIVVPDTNEQAAVAHQLDHLKGRWCHDPLGTPIECPR